MYTSKNAENYGLKRFFNHKKSKKYEGALTPEQKLEINAFFNNEKVCQYYKAWHFHLLTKFIDNDLRDYAERYIKIRNTAKHTLNYYTLCYGETKGDIEFNKFKRKAMENHGNQTQFWVNKGYNSTESKELVKSFQDENLKLAQQTLKGSKGKFTCRSKKYWLRKGYSEKDASDIVKNIQTTNTVEKYIQKYGKIEGPRRFKERNLKWTQDLKNEMIARGLWRDLSVLDLEEFENYYNLVVSLTEKNYRTYEEHINPTGLPRGMRQYELDHKVSKLEGFLNNISPEKISHPANLELMWWLDNRKKSSNSSISPQMLDTKITQWENNKLS